MGVKGLLPLLKSIQKPCSLKQFSGTTLGVDAYGWLHRGTIACAIELAQGKPTTKFVDFAMHRVRMLIHFGIQPFLVFDGDYLPSKKGTEKDRAAKRREAKTAGLELLRMGRTAQAYQELQKGIDVTPEMAKQLMDELDKNNIDFIVAPYEADSQLVYLEKQGTIQGIISEDSDMLVFGAKVLLTKLDQFGECVAIHRKDFTACREVSFVGWSDEEFRWMSILSGCDYLAPIGNVGLKTAHRLIRKHKTVDRVVKALQFDGKSKIPHGYMEDFRKADLTFQHQWVFCPSAKRLVHITGLKADMTADQLPYIGPEVEASIASRVARGKLHPHTKEILIATPLPLNRQNRTLEKALQHTRTPDLKKSPSIDSFFKLKRTPLAELDPNVFTPSPSQQRLLEQQLEEQPSTERLSRPPTLTRAVTDVTRSQSARRILSEMRPPPDRTSRKRQRLCSDSAISFAMNGSVKATPAHSRFFGGSSRYQSPSVLKASRKTSEKPAEVNIWSDDSIEEAMSQLEDVSASTMKSTTKKLTVFRDDIVDAEDASNETSQTESQVSIASVENAAWSQEEDHRSLEPGLPASPLHEKAGSVSADPDLDAEEESSITTAVTDARSADADGGDINEEDWEVAAKSPLKPLSVAKEFGVYLKGINSIGSEDHMIPNSDSEEDVLTEDTKPTFGLDLGKFAFTG
ncbi:PIN domain-like protein [Myriangium duriaei CBS 260.36]|uniref:PIN domain-like protein n=1 Tax=Myriangium duriaei CBS 260.36 TaxID=1168546 RepID=A0A9P4MIK9_9PEZI|nr:PIN domain-like protein [Myriangium duriaei CBS 260.36]